MATQAEVKWALKRPRIFPGHWAWLAGGFNAFIGYGTYMYSWSVLSSALMRAEKIKKADMAFATAAGRLVIGPTGPLWGYLIDYRLGPRYMAAIGFLIAGIGYILLGLWLVKAAWWVWLCYTGLIYLPFSWCLYACSNKIIGWYFVKTRGRWMAIHTIGSPFGGMTLSPVLAAVITATNWNNAAFLTAGLCFVGIPLALIFYRNKPPQAYGILPDNEKLPHERTKEELEAAKAKGAAKVMTADDFLPDMSIRDAMKTRAFWGLAWVGSLSFFSLAFPLFLTDHIRNLGFSLQDAANYFALQFPMSLLGRLLVAGLSDRFNPKIFYALGYIGAGIGMLTVAFATQQAAWLLWAYAPLYGIPLGLFPAVGTHMYATWFGRKWFITIQRFVGWFTFPTGFAGTWAVGLIADAYGGTYVVAFAFMAVSAILGGIGVWIIATQPKPMAEARRKAKEFGIRMQG